MSLQDEIAKQSATIRTDSYSLSVGELTNLYRDREINVHPEFQRVYRWTPGQKSRLIESLLLGIPIPPIFVAQKPDGVWDVVDGQQRLSTVLQFLGELRDEEKNLLPPLVLEKTKFLPSLQGKTWAGENSFSRDQQLFIKRAKFDVNIVQKESDADAKYELFMRLNTGGTPLEAQEVRNCLMLMAYPGLYEWIKELAKDEDFLSVVALSDRAIEEQYQMELVCRFLIFRKLPEGPPTSDASDPYKTLSDVVDIGDFLNESLKRIYQLSKSERAAEEAAFKGTFRALSEGIGENAFRRFDVEATKFKGGFLISAFEVVALGVGFNVGAAGKVTLPNDFSTRVAEVWSNLEFTSNAGSGVRASQRIPKIVPLGRKLFKK